MSREASEDLRDLPNFLHPGSETDPLVDHPPTHTNEQPTSQQSRRFNREPYSAHHHRRPNGELSAEHAQACSERQPLLLGGTEPVAVPDSFDEEPSLVELLTSDCPSVVSSDVRSGVRKDDVRSRQNDDTSSDVIPRQTCEAGIGAEQRDVGNTDDVKNNQRQGDVSGDVRNQRNNKVLPDIKIPLSDADKDDVSGALLAKGPSSPGGVARSFTSDCIRALGEEGESKEGQDATDHEPRPVRRRLSSGDAPHWLLSSQDGSSDMRTMTLVVPGPTRSQESYLIGRASPRGDGALVRMTRMTEVAPTNSSIVDDEDQWKMPLHLFTSKKKGKDIGQHKSKRIRSYYRAQDELITAYEDISLKVNDDLLDTDIIKRQRKLATFFSKLTLAVNVMLLIGKLVASILSGSISIISSLVDSVVDLLSGIIMWWATRAVKTRDPYTYPQGRTKLEPVAIIILSVVMALASLQLIRESVEKVVTLASDPTSLPRVEAPTFVIAGSTVVVKLVLWLVCRRVNSSIVQALAMDHRNDVLSNTVAIVCGYLGSREFQDEFDLQGFIYVDPAGAILISLYIVVNWWQTGSEQIKMLTGHTARPDFLSKLTWTAMNHDRNIRHIDTVRAFHFGNNFLVEMDIVLPEDMSLRVAHDIGESLQQKLENIPEVERAFVHLDYEFSHNPNSEHKVV